MRRKAHLAFAAVSLFAVLLFASGWLTTMWYQESARRSLEETLDTAKNAVALPQFPAKPEGKTETIVEKKYATAKVPSISCRGLKCKVTQREVRTLVAEVPVQKFSGPTTDEMREWEAAVASLEKQYQQSLQREIDRLQEQRLADAKARREGIKDWTAIFGSLFGTLLGAGNLVLALRKDKRESPNKPMQATRENARA